MQRWLIVTILLGALGLGACAPGEDSSSNPGPTGDGENRPFPPNPKPGDPATPVGACLEKTYDGKGQICSEHYSGSIELTPADVAHACAAANVSFVKTCPPNPKVSCRIKEPTYEVLMKVYVPDSQKDSWVKACQDRGGELTLGSEADPTEDPSAVFTSESLHEPAIKGPFLSLEP